MSKPVQTELRFRTHGGRRKGAGRPTTGRVSHEVRPKFRRITPAHVTLRMRDRVWNLRSSRSFRRIRASLTAARGRFGLRVIEFSSLGNHLHLIVEADDDKALARGIQGLAIRIARTLNVLMATSGRIFADHYHSHLLRSPTELMRAIRYVLQNAARHYGIIGTDIYSSAFMTDRDEVLSRARGWLLTEGRLPVPDNRGREL